jgi:hypothetical protein
VSATAYSLYSELPSIFEGRLLQPQPEVAPCRGDREPIAWFDMFIFYQNTKKKPLSVISLLSINFVSNIVCDSLQWISYFHNGFRSSVKEHNDKCKFRISVYTIPLLFIKFVSFAAWFLNLIALVIFSKECKL